MMETLRQPTQKTIRNLPDIGLTRIRRPRAFLASGVDFRARMYDPLLGRFVQPDTIIPGAGNPQAWNRYSYTTNNPVNYIDPSGHRSCNGTDENGNCEEDDWVPLPKIKILGINVIGQDKGSTYCGQAAFAMAWNFKHPESEVTFDNLKLLADDRGFHTENEPYTSPKQMQAMAEMFATRNNSALPISNNIDTSNKDAALSFLINELSNGNPIIIDVTTKIGNPSKRINDAHFILITGYNPNTNEIEYNDPYGYQNDKIDWNPGIYQKSFVDIWRSWSGNLDPGGQGWFMVVQ
jgi:RHS repeat-associated protein